MKLKSPFNGEVWTVPPECTPEFVAALLERGFIKVDNDPKSKEKR